METQNTEAQPACPKCGGAVAQVDLIAGTGPLVVTKPRSAFALGIARGSALAARVCISCGYAELYATNPEVLK